MKPSAGRNLPQVARLATWLPDHCQLVGLTDAPIEQVLPASFAALAGKDRKRIDNFLSKAGLLKGAVELIDLLGDATKEGFVFIVRQPPATTKRKLSLDASEVAIVIPLDANTQPIDELMGVLFSNNRKLGFNKAFSISVAKPAGGPSCRVLELISKEPGLVSLSIARLNDRIMISNSPVFLVDMIKLCRAGTLAELHVEDFAEITAGALSEQVAAAKVAATPDPEWLARTLSEARRKVFKSGFAAEHGSTAALTGDAKRRYGSAVFKYQQQEWVRECERSQMLRMLKFLKPLLEPRASTSFHLRLTPQTSDAVGRLIKIRMRR